MANKVPAAATLPRPPASGDLQAVYAFFPVLGKTLFELFSKIGLRVNLALVSDGTESMTAPLPLMSYTVAAVPAAASYEGAIIYVSNETGGKTLAFSDGTNWRRVQDRAIIA